jgi:hypothetical protein
MRPTSISISTRKSVAHHGDQAAAPAHQFVHAEILEVAAVGQVDKIRVGIGQAEQFGNQVEQSQPGRGAAAVGRLAARIGEPAAEPDIEQGHQE